LFCLAEASTSFFPLVSFVLVFIASQLSPERNFASGVRALRIRQLLPVGLVAIFAFGMVVAKSDTSLLGGLAVAVCVAAIGVAAELIETRVDQWAKALFKKGHKTGPRSVTR